MYRYMEIEKALNEQLKRLNELQDKLMEVELQYYKAKDKSKRWFSLFR